MKHLISLFLCLTLLGSVFPRYLKDEEQIQDIYIMNIIIDQILRGIAILPELDVISTPSIDFAIDVNGSPAGLTLLNGTLNHLGQIKRVGDSVGDWDLWYDIGTLTLNFTYPELEITYSYSAFVEEYSSGIVNGTFNYTGLSFYLAYDPENLISVQNWTATVGGVTLVGLENKDWVTTYIGPVISHFYTSLVANTLDDLHYRVLVAVETINASLRNGLVKGLTSISSSSLKETLAKTFQS